MAQFSGAVRITDLNDYIAPSQACIVKLGAKQKDAEKIPSAEVSIQGRRAGAGATPYTDTPDPVKVTLHDCLACSGCLTSAETVLLDHQSTTELLQYLNLSRDLAQDQAVVIDRQVRSDQSQVSTSGRIFAGNGLHTDDDPSYGSSTSIRSDVTMGVMASNLVSSADPALRSGSSKVVIISVSPQSVAALAILYSISCTEAARRLSGALRSLGVAAVYNVGDGRDLAMIETAAEFIERYKSKHSTSMDIDDQPSSSTPQPLPMLASSCPGWVCYAEKSHGEWVLPYLSSARSPQAVMGALIKRCLAPGWGRRPEEIYHATIMPCYDKKLEASRDEFKVPGTSIPEVDASLTTSEIHDLLLDRGIDLRSAPECALDPLIPGWPAHDGKLYGVPGGSGGWLEFVFRTASDQLFGRTLPPGPLDMKVLRNADMREASLEVDGTAPLRVASVYGFRNIQTLLRKMRSGRCEYSYVEVMACPGGCLHGAGQLKGQGGATVPAAASTAALLEEMEKVYHKDLVPRSPVDNPVVAAAYERWIGTGPLSMAASALLHTTYVRREKTVTAAAVGDW